LNVKCLICLFEGWLFWAADLFLKAKNETVLVSINTCFSIYSTWAGAQSFNHNCQERIACDFYHLKRKRTK
jgi:hypothetical protein